MKCTIEGNEGAIRRCIYRYEEEGGGKFMEAEYPTAGATPSKKRKKLTDRLGSKSGGTNKEINRKR